MASNSGDNSAKTPEERMAAPADQIVESHHTLTVDGRELRYTVMTGTVVLKEESEGKGEREGQSEGEKPRATIFFTAYTLDAAADRAERPITFAFNGGPGSSSIWLHLGMLGPRRVLMHDEGWPLPPPYRLVDNLYTLLTETDLVFIDPVSTGYSRPTPGERAKDFHGFRKDIESVGDFIRLYTTRYGRWTSPKFLAGESYGTTRAAGLSGYLQDRHGLYLNGIILISAVLDFSTIEFDTGNEQPYIMFLPTYAATAWYHKRLPAGSPTGLRETLAAVEAYALGDYTLALMQGAALPADAANEAALRLARYTGLTADYISRSDLRIRDARFTKELLRGERRTVGRLDSRFTGFDRDAAGETTEFDPSYAAIQGPYTATFYDYVRRELNFQSDLPYESINPRVWPWSYAQHENRYVNVAETLRQAMSINPHLKVFVASGYFDLATPYLATRYTFNHLGLDPSLRGNIRMEFYEAGHMMYLHLPSLARLKTDLAGFIADSIKR